MGLAKQARCRDRATTGTALQLHRSADGPRRELVVAVAEVLALGFFSGRGLENELEEALTGLRHTLAAIDDGAAIEVHVFFLVHEEGRVGGELERRRGLAAVGRA